MNPFLEATSTEQRGEQFLAQQAFDWFRTWGCQASTNYESEKLENSWKLLRNNSLKIIIFHCIWLLQFSAIHVLHVYSIRSSCDSGLRRRPASAPKSRVQSSVDMQAFMDRDNQAPYDSADRNASPERQISQKKVRPFSADITKR